MCSTTTAVDLWHRVWLRQLSGTQLCRPNRLEVGAADTCTIESGLFDGVTLGSTIMVRVPNKDQRSGDYSEMAVAYRCERGTVSRVPQLTSDTPVCYCETWLLFS